MQMPPNYGADYTKRFAQIYADIAREKKTGLVPFMRVLAEISPKARANPKTLAHLDGYKRPLVSSLSGNLQRFGMDKVSKVRASGDHCGDDRSR